MRRILFSVFALALIIAAAATAQVKSFGLRMIVVRTETEANDVLARLRAGAKFDELARGQSRDSSASRGGYLGVFTTAELRPEFLAALEGLNPGQTSPIVKVGREFALLQLLTAEEMRAIGLKNSAGAPAASGARELIGLWTAAISANDSALIKKLLNDGADVNAPFGDGSTVLMGAAQAGQIEIVRALLAAGAAVNAQTMDGMTALLVAAQAGHTEIVRALLGAGAAVNARKADGGTALMDAAFGGHVEIVRLLLESHADPNITLENGSSALMAASVKGHNEIVRKFLQANADVNAGSNGGGTALMEAAYAGHAETVRILLAAGADAKVANSKGLTALMGAALGGHTEAVETLLDAGASAVARDARGWTVLTFARASANPATVRMILDKTKDISSQERSIALGGTYLNEYYSSNQASLLEMAAAEFQKVLSIQPQNVEALEWMGTVEFLQWDKPPTLEQFRKANAFLKKSVDLDTKDPDRHCWIAAISSIFISAAKGVFAIDKAAILEDGIQHAKRAIELDPRFADAMDHLSVLYRRKSELISSEKEQLLKLAEAAHQDAVRVRQRLGNRPSRFNDQFSRPALPPAPGN